MLDTTGFNVTLEITNNCFETSNTLNKIWIQQSIVFYPILLYPQNFVSFKPLYLPSKLIFSIPNEYCNDDRQSVFVVDDIDAWLNTNFQFNTKLMNEYEETFEYSNMKNVFLTSTSSDSDIDSSDLLSAMFQVSIDNTDDVISNANGLTTVITDSEKLVMSKIDGKLKALIENGNLQYYPSDSNWDSHRVVIDGSRSFDQNLNIFGENNDLNSHLTFEWSCVKHNIISINGSGNNNIGEFECDGDILDDNTMDVIRFNKGLMSINCMYEFTFTISDTSGISMRNASEKVFVLSSEQVSMIIEVNIDWDDDLYFMPVYNDEISISARIAYLNPNEDASESVLDSDITRWTFEWCISPSLNDGTECWISQQKSTSLESIWDINALNTSPGQRYVCCLRLYIFAVVVAFVVH